MRYLNSLRVLALMSVLALGGAAAVFVGKVGAQTPNLFGPFNTDLGAIITNAARVAGTVTSSTIVNADKRGVVCTFLQTAVSGSPSTTFKIQSYDAATASWNDLVTSGAITNSTSNIYTLSVYPGLIAADVPSNGVGKGIPLPRAWRVSQTIAGSNGPATTGKIGCNTLK